MSAFDILNTGSIQVDYTARLGQFTNQNEFDFFVIKSRKRVLNASLGTIVVKKLLCKVTSAVFLVTHANKRSTCKASCTLCFASALHR